MKIQVLEEKGQNHCEIACTLGVSEGTVRYRLWRMADGVPEDLPAHVTHASRKAGPSEGT